MFNWFKNKSKNLIPNDFNSGLMTSDFCTIKLGTNLSLPENCFGFVCFKDKVYLEMPSGEHNLSETTLKLLYERQAKKDKIKKIKIDLFFINTKNFDFKLHYQDVVSIKNGYLKLIFNVDFSCMVEKPRRFAENVWAIKALVNAEESNQLLQEDVEDFLRKIFFKMQFTKLELTSEEREQIHSKLSKHLNKLGIKLNRLVINISDKSGKFKGGATSSFFDNFYKPTNQQNNNSDKITTTNVKTTTNIDESAKNSVKDIDENKNLGYTNNTSSEEFCPRCKQKLIAGAIFCHRCGYRK